MAIQIAELNGALDRAIEIVQSQFPRIVVIFDLSAHALGKYIIMPLEDALKEEMLDQERKKLLETDNDFFHCARVPLFGNSTTLIVQMKTGLICDDGTVIDQTVLVSGFREILRREYSPRKR